MPFRRQIPSKLKILHPKLTMLELRAIVNQIFNTKTQVLTQARVFSVKLKGLGTIRTHKSKLPKNIKTARKKDKIKKRNQRKKKELTKEKLLW